MEATLLLLTLGLTLINGSNTVIADTGLTLINGSNTVIADTGANID